MPWHQFFVVLKKSLLEWDSLPIPLVQMLVNQFLVKYLYVTKFNM